MEQKDYRQLLFQSTELSSFLGDVLTEKKSITPRFSLRAWAKRLGQRSPSMLSAVIAGTRKITPDLADKLSDDLCQEPDERLHFNILYLKNIAKEKDKKRFDELIKAQLDGKRTTHFDKEAARIVSDWYCSAIMEMPALKDFCEETEYIARRLGNKVSKKSISDTIRRLHKLGIFKYSETGETQRVQINLHLGSESPKQIVRRQHRQMLEKAINSIQQSPDSRHLWGTTIAIKKGNYRKITKCIEKFHKSLSKFETSSDADDVYRFSSQFFALTSKE